MSTDENLVAGNQATAEQMAWRLGRGLLPALLPPRFSPLFGGGGPKYRDAQKFTFARAAAAADAAAAYGSLSGDAHRG